MNGFTSGDWPPGDSRLEVLTEAKIREMFDALTEPPTWLVRVRDAETVMVRANRYLPDGTGILLVDDPSNPGTILIACRPESLEEIRLGVEEIRGQSRAP